MVCRSRNAHVLHSGCINAHGFPQTEVPFFPASKLASTGKLKPLNDQVIDWSWADLICSKMRYMSLSTNQSARGQSIWVLRKMSLCHLKCANETQHLFSESSNNYFGDWTPRFSHAFSHWEYIETRQLVKPVLSQTPRLSLEDSAVDQLLFILLQSKTKSGGVKSYFPWEEDGSFSFSLKPQG